ncbi:MAG: class I SAM-dependent methyltransferase [Planctomycetes bacterium]|nr:class I SAM-dependent methyltransferase [Planctomycetota bacterium]
MNTKTTPDNPFRYDRYGFAWQTTPPDSQAHFDFGCYRGDFLQSLENKGIKQLVGADISADAVRIAKEKSPTLEFITLTQTVPLPFEDERFSSITLLDVIEHVYEQSALLDELHRVLTQDGFLIVTVPGKHIFSFLDRGNFKFRFPRLHRWYYIRTHSQDQYHKRYVANPDGLIGDISAKKQWHEHFSRNTLIALLKKSGFAVVRFDGTGLFSRPIGHIGYFLQRIKPLKNFFDKILEIDAKMFESTNLFCLARKIDHSSLTA